VKKIALLPPEGWPEAARQRFLEFGQFLAHKLVQPREPLRLLCALLRTQERMGLTYREFPPALWEQHGQGMTAKNQVECHQALRSWMQYLYRHGDLLLPLHEELGLPKKYRAPRRPWLTYEDVLRWLELPPLETPEGLRDRAYLEVAYATGLRRGELASLNLSDVDLAEGTLLVRFPKNGQDRLLPLGAWARHYVEQYLREGRTQLSSPLSPNALWLGKRGQRMNLNEVARRMRKVYRAQERLGYTLKLHQLRHVCASHLLQHGAPLVDVQALLGHRRLNSTMVYTQVTPTQLQRVHRATHPRFSGQIPDFGTGMRYGMGTE
jgi:site-specific recombinase XerD